MSKGGARPGAGRKKGGKNAATIEKEAVLAQYRQKILGRADVIFNSQLSLVKGLSYLYVIKTIKGVKQRPELIEDQATIEAYLAEELEEEENEYYYITTTPPESRAIDSMLDRAFGKVKQDMDLTTNGKDLPTPIYGGASVPKHDSDKKDIQA